MKTTIKALAVAVVTLASMAAHAQSCTATLNEMISKWQTEGKKTTLTMLSHQGNGLRTFSGAHAPVAGAPEYEARLVWNGNWMTNTAPGGSRGKVQFSDRLNTTQSTFATQNFSVVPGAMTEFDFYVGSNLIVLRDATWGNWIWISNLRCENGVIWGLGDPIGNNNGGRRAVYVFSFGFSAT